MMAFLLISLASSFTSMIICFIGSLCNNNHRDTYAVVSFIFMMIFLISIPFCLYWHNIDNKTKACLYSSRYNDKKHCCDQIRYDNDDDDTKYLFKDCKE